MKPRRTMTDAEVYAAFDAAAAQTSGGLNYWAAEIARRDSANRERRMLWMTAAITLLTLANVVLVAVSLLRD